MDHSEATAPSYRLPRRSGLDPATKRLGLIATSLGATLLVVIGAWSALGTGRHSVPVIVPPGGPVRVKPANPGGMQLSDNNMILSDALKDSGGDKLAPPPESPDPAALSSTAPADAAPANAAPPPTTARAAPGQHAVKPALPPLPPGTQAAGGTAAQVSNATPAAKSVQTALATPRLPPPQAAPAPDKSRHTDTARGSGEHGALVQLAALGSKEGAEAEWRQLARRMPELLAGKMPQFVHAEHDGHTIWRVRTGGFADPGAARSFCERVRAKGGACSVVL